MSGAIVQAAYNVDDSGTLGTTIAATLSGVTSGNRIAVHVGWSDTTGTVTSSVSDGTAYSSAAAKVRDGTNTQASQVYELENAGAGSHTITATISTSVGFRRIRAYEISGTLTSGGLDQATGAANAATTTPGSGASAATTNANDFVVGFLQDTGETDPGTGTVSAGPGYTIGATTNRILAIESKSVTVTGAQTASFTTSLSQAAVVHVVAWKEAAAAGGGARTSQFLGQPMIRGPF